jgi:signal transduction histidine kinase
MCRAFVKTRAPAVEEAPRMVSPRPNSGTRLKIRSNRSAYRASPQNRDVRAPLRQRVDHLRDARRRITADAERQRIERDLHDGAQSAWSPWR